MGELWESIKAYWITWLLGIISASLTAKLYKLKKWQEDQKCRQVALEIGMESLLQDRIIQAYEHYTFEKGYVTLHGLTAVNKMYNSYIMLDKDDSIKKLMETIQSLEVRTE